jgi:hypothetical protein
VELDRAALLAGWDEWRADMHDKPALAAVLHEVETLDR